MTKILSLIFLVFGFSIASAVSFEIMDPCTGRPKVQSSEILTSLPFPSVGHYTVAQLKKRNIPFTGNQAGLSSIFNTPISDAAVDVVGPQQMFAYGWCYHVNGIESDKMAYEVKITNNSDRITWFFAFTEYRNGQWLTMCTPAWKRPLKSYCR